MFPLSQLDSTHNYHRVLPHELNKRLLDRTLTIEQELIDRVFNDSPLQQQIHKSMLEGHRLIDAGYTALGHQYRRLKLRRGSKRAAVAVAYSLLVVAYHILKD